VCYSWSIYHLKRVFLLIVLLTRGRVSPSALATRLARLLVVIMRRPMIVWGRLRLNPRAVIRGFKIQESSWTGCPVPSR
jgi:hypothetical protein